MENTPDGFDRANEQGKNHDTKGNVANVGNDTIKQDKDDKDLAKKIPTVTPENDNGDLENPTDENSSNKGQGPQGENL
jgi:hypothetical protein